MFRASPSPTVVVAALLTLAVGGFVTVPASAAVPPAHESADALLGADLARGLSPLILDEARGFERAYEEARGFVRPDQEARGFVRPDQEARGFVRPDQEARGFEPAHEEARGFVRPDLEARGPVTRDEARGFDPEKFDVAMGGHIQSLIRQLHDESRPVDDTAGTDRALNPLTA